MRMKGTVEISGPDEARTSQPPVVPISIQRIKERDRRKVSESNSFASVDFETAISKSGCGKFNFALLLLSFPAACTSGFVSSSMSYVIPAATVDLGLTPTSKALLQSACYVGMISSGFIWGFLSDTLGRKKLLVTGFLLDFLMNFLTGVVPSLPLMLLFKYLSGFMVSGPFSIFTTYMSEVFLRQKRDMAVLSVGLFAAIGGIFQACLAMWLIPAEVPFQLPLKGWQLFHISCGLPSLICGLGCLFCVESPKFLIEHGDHEGALKVCKTIYAINTGRDPSTYPVKKLQHQISKTDNKKTFWTITVESTTIFRSPFIQRAIKNFIIHLGIVGSINTIRLWLPEMLMLVKSSTLDVSLGLCPLLVEGHTQLLKSASSNNDKNDVYMDLILVQVGTVIGHLCCILAVNHFGKKMVLICCSLIASACVVAMPFISADYAFIPASLFICVCNVSFMANIGIVAAIFPTRLRATSVSMTMLIGRLSILFINFMIANLIYSYCEYIFYSVGTVSLGIATLGIFLSQKPIEDEKSPSQNHEQQ